MMAWRRPTGRANATSSGHWSSGWKWLGATSILYFGSIHIRVITIPKKKVCNFVGGEVSPILSNIYMDRLDRFVEDTLIPKYSREERREIHPIYGQLTNQLATARRQGNLERIRVLQKELRQYPSQNPDDPVYRRLRYVRYADDFLLGFAGPLVEAHQIKDSIASFLQTELKLTLSAEKTLITHAHTGRARFLGYEVGIMESQTKLDRTRGTRTVNGKVGIYIPEDVIRAKRKRYLRDGKPIHRSELINDSEYDIIYRYQGEYRGLVNYYGLAQNLAELGYLRWTMATSLLQTLACKNQTSVAQFLAVCSAYILAEMLCYTASLASQFRAKRNVF